MTKLFTNPQTFTQIAVVVVEEYDRGDGPMYLVHKLGATSAKYVFGIRASDCRDI